MIRVKCFRQVKRLRDDESGAPLAELALVIPMLLVMLFGMMEFANLLYQQQVITKGVQEAARLAARSPAITGGGICPPNAAAGSSWATTTSQAKNLATHGVPSGGSLILPNFDNANVTVSILCEASTGMYSSNPASGMIPVVRVQASIGARSLGFASFLSAGPITLQAEHREMGIGL